MRPFLLTPPTHPTRHIQLEEAIIKIAWKFATATGQKEETFWRELYHHCVLVNVDTVYFASRFEDWNPTIIVINVDMVMKRTDTTRGKPTGLHLAFFNGGFLFFYHKIYS